MQESIFTKIIKGEIPCHKVYEDDKVFAFLDISPIQPGHTLVIPKKQVEFVWDMEQEDYDAVMSAARKIAARLRDKLAVSYVGSKVVGIDVPHAHVHLIPFNTLAEYNNVPDKAVEPDHVELSRIAEIVRF